MNNVYYTVHCTYMQLVVVLFSKNPVWCWLAFNPSVMEFCVGHWVRPSPDFDE